MHHSKLDSGRKVPRRAGPLHCAGQATLADVAAAAGVSQMTVSRVINDGPVSDKTRRIVQQALDALEYRPNQAARALAASRKAPSSSSSGDGGASRLPFHDLWAPYGQFIAGMLRPRS